MSYEDISIVYNKKIKKDCPYIPFFDLAITFRVLATLTGDSVGSVLVTNELQDKWDVNTKELYKNAGKNTRSLFPEKIVKIDKFISACLPGLCHDEDDIAAYNHIPYVVTNKMGVNGASVILYPRILKELSYEYDEDFYLLPSSIHEMLTVPASIGMNINCLKDMVCDVNKTCVSREEYLSDSVYKYVREKDEVVMLV